MPPVFQNGLLKSRTLQIDQTFINITAHAAAFKTQIKQTVKRGPKRDMWKENKCRESVQKSNLNFSHGFYSIVTVLSCHSRFNGIQCPYTYVTAWSERYNSNSLHAVGKVNNITKI